MGKVEEAASIVNKSGFLGMFGVRHELKKIRKEMEGIRKEMERTNLTNRMEARHARAAKASKVYYGK